MVGVINPVSPQQPPLSTHPYPNQPNANPCFLFTKDPTHTFEAQYAKALQYPYMLVPGQSMPAEGSTSTSSRSSSSGAHLSRGAIAGIAVLSVVFVGSLVLLVFVLGRNRVYSQWMSSQDGRNKRTARWAIGTGSGTDAGVGARNSVGRGVNPWSRGSELDSDGVQSPPTDVAFVSVNSGVGTGVGMGMGGQDAGLVEGSASGGHAVLPPYQASAHGYENGYGQGQGHWRWDGVQGSRVHRGPVELEAHGVGYWSSEKGGEREYR